MIEKIVSGGQTGADRAGLDAAMACGVPHGRWCPKGRTAEDGRIPAVYLLRETAEELLEVRTERNVIDSDGTVIFTLGALSGGSLKTAEFARAHGRPWLHVDLTGVTDEEAVRVLGEFVEGNGIRVLNVAGSRGSAGVQVGRRTFEIVRRVLGAIGQWSTVSGRVPREQ